jgi:hypothetical protein
MGSAVYSHQVKLVHDKVAELLLSSEDFLDLFERIKRLSQRILNSVFDAHEEDLLGAHAREAGLWRERKKVLLYPLRGGIECIGARVGFDVGALARGKTLQDCGGVDALVSRLEIGSNLVFELAGWRYVFDTA